MLNVQKFLKDNHKFEDLAQFGIAIKKHPVHDIYILDYDQIESKINHPMSDECRGLVLDSKFDVVSGCMRRFYNYGQCAEYEKDFNWNDFIAWEKRDGSMIAICRYKGELLIRTRFSWADSEVGLSGKTWTELVLDCLTVYQKDYMLNRCVYNTFIFELETPFNQVVLYHEIPKLVLLTIIHDSKCKEWTQVTVEDLALVLEFNRPKKFTVLMDTIEGVQGLLDIWEQAKKKDEGFVLLDGNGKRLKVKNKYYMLYHSMCTGIQSIRQVFDIVWNPNIDVSEIVIYFPHLAPKLQEVETAIKKAFDETYDIWFLTQDLKERKKFAMSITKPDSKYYTRFSSILFRLRDDEGVEQPSDFRFREEWNKSKDLIFKALFKE